MSVCHENTFKDGLTIDDTQDLSSAYDLACRLVRAADHDQNIVLRALNRVGVNRRMT
jgi:hypothetical protein